MKMGSFEFPNQANEVILSKAPNRDDRHLKNDFNIASLDLGYAESRMAFGQQDWSIRLTESCSSGSWMVRSGKASGLVAFGSELLAEGDPC